MSVLASSTFGRGDLQLRRGKHYNQWSIESNTLLELMVDAAERGWGDANGSFSAVNRNENSLFVQSLSYFHEKCGRENIWYM